MRPSIRNAHRSKAYAPERLKCLPVGVIIGIRAEAVLSNNRTNLVLIQSGPLPWWSYDKQLGEHEGFPPSPVCTRQPESAAGAVGPSRERERERMEIDRTKRLD